ncbi:hypothetical protein BLNAU_20961 [Blattamonas nauphoetae]|uniref:Uncharacterized protein n=1 Tax=Blattamonas nauphoetae TaxID=2049346 RepID=A0ABQ9WXB0_9EUKA|nr:hypothetical protein BLNAU_20961 [Blattamonas nauphoetae]
MTDELFAESTTKERKTQVRVAVAGVQRRVGTKVRLREMEWVDMVPSLLPTLGCKSTQIPRHLAIVSSVPENVTAFGIVRNVGRD